MMSLTPDHFRKSSLGVAPSPAPFFTPRPEKRRIDSRSSDWSSNRQDRDKEVNVQVLLRCRPLSDDEQKSNIPRVIHCNEHKREVTILQSVANKQVDKVFTFDKVFGPKAQQRSIYDQAVAPIVHEVLEGFNCTVFAYGQTGTGKTYTMEGGMRNKGGDLPAEAGVIPRAVRHIFELLEAQNADYSMKVTFLEIYNEEITDLLAPEDCLRSMEERQKKPISLMEDGKGCVVVRGLEEEAVYSSTEIYNLLERGSAKRRTADTLLNKRSSRSHSVFSITVHVKETAVGDEELIKCGKLNLVDLAGSENISRSGAREGRAREAGEINKSLLTLGRVINALVEHTAHIPYRDSKLTRLLRDSLGGKTKTCILATISPSANCLEETLSTLDYAYRAKNIKNKPEANQKMTKAVLLKDLYLEIDRMREDVKAARERNGVYIPNERFAKEESEKKARNEKIEQLEIELNMSEKQVDNFRELYHTEQEQRMELERDLKDCRKSLEISRKDILEVQENHKGAISNLKEKEFVISKLLHSESSIIERAKELRTDLQNASEDITSLYAKLDHKNKLEVDNQNMILTFGSQLDHNLKNMHKIILGSVSQQHQQIRCLEEHAQSFLASKYDATQVLESRINKMTEKYTSGMQALKELANILQHKTSSDLDNINSMILSQSTSVQKFLVTAVLEASEVISEIQNSLNEQRQLLDFTAQLQQKGLQQSLVSAQVTSNAAVGVFNDLHQRASKVMRTLEEIHMEKSNQLEKFENNLKEEAIKDEKLALEKISIILGSLTSKKASMVSDALRNIRNSDIQEKERLQKEMSNMQHVSDNAKTGLNEYIKRAEVNFFDDTFSAAETRNVMENCIHESSMKVDYSRQLWENAKISISNLNMLNVEEIETRMKNSIRTNHATHTKLISATSSVDEEFYDRASGLQVAVKESLILDHESKRTLDSVTTLCFDQLKSIQGKHSESISNIRSQADNYLTKEYLVDQCDHSTPKKREIIVPSLSSIENMRMHAYKDGHENNSSETRPKLNQAETKITQMCNRTPFQHVN